MFIAISGIFTISPANINCSAVKELLKASTLRRQANFKQGPNLRVADGKTFSASEFGESDYFRLHHDFLLAINDTGMGKGGGKRAGGDLTSKHRDDLRKSQLE